MIAALLMIGIVVVIVMALYSKEKNEQRKQEGLEEAILRARRLHNWDIVHNYCSAECISEEVMIETRKKLITRLAEQGDLEAMNEMALKSTTPDERCKWLTRCAEAGDIEAMYSLAFGHSVTANEPDSKLGCGVDPEKEFYWYNLAASKGHERAMSGVAECYYDGAGVPKDRQKSFDYAKDCADRGYSACAFFLVKNFWIPIDDPHLSKAEIIKMMERVMLRGEQESFAEAAKELGYAYGRAYLYNQPVDEFSDRRKAAYFFTLAHILDSELYSKERIFETGYRPSQFEWNQWVEDARNYRFNPM